MDSMPLETLDEGNESSSFVIRLNSTYMALYHTNEPIAISAAKELRERMDQIIFMNRNHENINVIIYSPANHDYHKQEFKTYFDSLSDSDSIQGILLPFYSVIFHNLSDENESHLEQELHLLNPDKLDIKLREGAYDILDYQSCSFELRYGKQNDEGQIDFAFFFAIRLGTEPIAILDAFLDFHLVHNFDNNTTAFNRFLERVATEYKELIITEGRCKLVDGWKVKEDRLKMNDHIILTSALDNKPEGPEDEQESGHPKVIRLKPGRKTSKKFEIPMPSQRVANGNTSEEIALLFKYLQDEKIIHDKDMVSDTNAAIAIKGLTGYGEENIRKYLGGYKFSKTAKQKVLAKLKKITDVISRDLSQ